MVDVISRVAGFYDYLGSDIDPRVKDWPLMSSPIEPLLLVIAYLVFVYMGPKWMDSRKPMKLQNVLVFYNFFMVALSAYTVHEMLLGGWLTSYSLSCDQEVDYSTSPTAIRMASATWLFFIAKYIELFDTVFFILRKKQSQVTFLHVFHHGCLPVFWWWGVKAVPGGFGTFHALVNCCVHVVMYLYYGIAALGPDYQKYIWWKKYVTKFQLAQFFIVTVHNSQFLFRTCAYPWKYVAFIQGFTTLIAILFLNFYVQAYRKPKYLQIKSQRISNGVLSNGHEVIGHSNKYSNGAAVNGSIVANGYCRSELKRRPLYS